MSSQNPELKEAADKALLAIKHLYNNPKAIDSWLRQGISASQILAGL